MPCFIAPSLFSLVGYPSVGTVYQHFYILAFYTQLSKIELGYSERDQAVLWNVFCSSLSSPYSCCACLLPWMLVVIIFELGGLILLFPRTNTGTTLTTIMELLWIVEVVARVFLFITGHHIMATQMNYWKLNRWKTPEGIQSGWRLNQVCILPAYSGGDIEVWAD